MAEYILIAVGIAIVVELHILNGRISRLRRPVKPPDLFPSIYEPYHPPHFDD